MIVRSKGGGLLAGGAAIPPRAGTILDSPKASFSDSFARADAGTLGSSWEEDVGTWGIASNSAQPTSGIDCIASVVGWSSVDTDISCQAGIGDANEGCGIVLRYDPVAGNGYLVTAQRSGSTYEINVSTIDAGVIHTFYTSSPLAAGIWSLSVHQVGPDITVQWNGVTITTQTDSTYPGPGACGIYVVFQGFGGIKLFTAQEL